jgi:hypothetical protein
MNINDRLKNRLPVFRPAAGCLFDILLNTRRGTGLSVAMGADAGSTSFTTDERAASSTGRPVEELGRYHPGVGYADVSSR